MLYQLSHKRSPRILEWVAYPFSREPSLLRNWTKVSCIAGGFFTSRDVREASIRPPFKLITSSKTFISKQVPSLSYLALGLERVFGREAHSSSRSTFLPGIPVTDSFTPVFITTCYCYFSDASLQIPPLFLSVTSCPSSRFYVSPRFHATHPTCCLSSLFILFLSVSLNTSPAPRRQWFHLLESLLFSCRKRLLTHGRHSVNVRWIHL